MMRLKVARHDVPSAKFDTEIFHRNMTVEFIVNLAILLFIGKT